MKNQLNSLYSYIQNKTISDDVLTILFPDGAPSLDEGNLWDYKLYLPCAKKYPDKEELNHHINEIAKDVLSFYNSYGGVIVSGVKNDPRVFISDDSDFDAEELRKKIKNASGVDIDLRFSYLTHKHQNKLYKLGILLIPQREEKEKPAEFKKESKQFQRNNKPKKAYGRGCYLRNGPECEKADTADHWCFLLGAERFTTYAKATIPDRNPIENNLRQRDPSLYKFVGRQESLSTLWEWLNDMYATVKVVSGYGGLGKTTLCRKFAEDIIASSPYGIEKVIWLTAKKRVYDVTRGKVRDTEWEYESPQFQTPTEMCRKILFELAYEMKEIPSYDELSDYLDLLVETLRTFPVLLIIDDTDTLVEEQHELFQFLNIALNRVISSSNSVSRAIITTRQTLGAAGNQLMEISGLPLVDFKEYIRTLLDKEYQSKIELSDKQIRKIHTDCSGSPLFASAILRLMKITNQSLDKSLSDWKGQDGIEVRRFAFERELKRLSHTQVQILFTLSVLTYSSEVELEEVLHLPSNRIRDDIVRLREYHLISDTPDEAPEAFNITIPSGLKQLQDIMNAVISNPSQIRRRCKAVRSGKMHGSNEYVSTMINKTLSYLRQDNYSAALTTAEYANSRTDNKNADLVCLLGRVLISFPEGEQRTSKADAEFRKSYDLGCRSEVLFRQWLKVRKIRSDWDGVIEVTKLAEQSVKQSFFAVERAKAYINKADDIEKMGDHVSAMDCYLAGVKSIQNSFKNNNVENKKRALSELKKNCFDGAFNSAQKVFTTDSAGIELWHITVLACESRTPRIYMIEAGAKALLSWSRQVFTRDNFHLTTRNKLGEAVNSLRWITNNYSRLIDSRKPDLVGVLEQILLELSDREERYHAIEEVS
ncbi:AAA family ATPase [Terasakiella pusilla]|uniref:AAA family ATPase n=1 Tax=Terasakiella pusilla TaxID=64973 RepID=UPI003AA98C29